MAERKEFFLFEKLKDRGQRLIGLGVIIAVSGLSGCKSVETEVNAFIIPWGDGGCAAVYLNGAEKNQSLVDHEKRHIEECREDGWRIFYREYFNGKACEMEKKAGLIFSGGRHVVCGD